MPISTGANSACFIRRLKRILATCSSFFLLSLASLSASAQSAQDLVGFWYKPSESGWGLSIQQQGVRTFAIWFTYNEQGATTFYSLECGFAGNTCAGDIYTYTGTPLPQITAGANTTATKVGTGSIVTTAVNRLSLSYSIGTVNQTKADLEPQNFVAADQVPVCTLQTSTGNGFRAGLTNYTDHWWGGSNASGWGVQISHQGTQVFAGWYSYSPAGKATWLTLQGVQDSANPKRFTGSIYQIASGPPFPTITGPIPPGSNVAIGSFTFTFTDGETGVFSYSIPAPSSYAANGSLPIQRFAIAGGAVNVCAVTKTQAVTAAVASRFLGQATFGPKMSDIDSVTATGLDAWLNSQFAKPQTLHLPQVTAYLNTLPADQQRGQTAFQWSLWKNFATGDDALRQRVAFALSEIFVISNNSSLSFAYPRGPANYLDMLGTHAFGNYRNLLEAVTYSPMMGLYLTHLRNQKENAATGTVPDENYAREVMQLMSIGLYQLNQDGTQKRDGNGKLIETYSNADVSGLAKVMTGLSWAGPDTSTNRFNGGGLATEPDREIKPMQAYDQFHSTSQKQFLGVTIPPQTIGQTNNDVRIALDTLFNHPNVGPFIGKQLIQKLVSSNPSEQYVSRVAAAFNNNGSGVRGDMKAVLRAVLLDVEARGAATATSGKLREPAVRFVHWMRSFSARSADGRFLLGTTSDPASQLAQSPMYSPSVFNFFRPGYIPPNSKVGAVGLVVPEAQITNETSVAGYLNYMRGVITSGIGTATGGVRDIQADYTAELALATNPDALIDRVSLLLTGGTLTASTRASVRAAVASVTDTRNRVNLAIYLIMASPDYIFQN
ncbi:MAG: DUF1800 domain-containing protein [Usitatibacteraceae bacterium]